MDTLYTLFAMLLLDRSCVIVGIFLKYYIPQHKYLGMPSDIGTSKFEAFKYLKDRMWSKVKGWMETNIIYNWKGGASEIRCTSRTGVFYVRLQITNRLM